MFTYIRTYIHMCIHVHTGGEAVGGSYFGMGSGDLFFSQFSCSESNTRLRECSFEAVQSQFCSTHSNDAGVICTGTCTYCAQKKNPVMCQTSHASSLMMRTNKLKNSCPGIAVACLAPNYESFHLCYRTSYSHYFC